MSFLFIFPIPPPTPRVKSNGKLSFKIPRPKKVLHCSLLLYFGKYTEYIYVAYRDMKVSLSLKVTALVSCPSTGMALHWPALARPGVGTVVLSQKSSLVLGLKWISGFKQQSPLLLSSGRSKECSNFVQIVYNDVWPCITMYKCVQEDGGFLTPVCMYIMYNV